MFVNIEIKGVVVNSTPIDEIEISKILTTGDQYVISTLLSDPLKIIKDTASIEKIPYIRKIAPKDSSEFKPDAVPDTAFYQPVNYIFETDKGIKIIVYQTEERKQGDSKNQFMFDLQHRLVNFKAAMKDIIHFKVPEYQLYIKIKVPSADAQNYLQSCPKVWTDWNSFVKDSIFFKLTLEYILKKNVGLVCSFYLIILTWEDLPELLE